MKINQPENKLFWFNPEVDCVTRAPVPANENKVFHAIQHSLEYLMLFLAKKYDTVYFRNKINKEHLEYLSQVGVELPQVSNIESMKKNIKDVKVSQFAPWGWSHEVVEEIKGSEGFNSEIINDVDNILELNSKSYSRSLSIELLERDKDLSLDQTYLGFECRSLDECVDMSEKYFNAKYDTVVFKAPFGTAGRGFKFLKSKELDLTLKKWAQNVLQNQGSIVVEPWVKRLNDFSLIFENREGKASFLSETKMIIDSRGGYKGCWVKANQQGSVLNEEYLDLLTKILTKRLFEKLKVIKNICFSVDGFTFFNHKDEIALRPISEINFRYSMGRIAVELKKYLSDNSLALLRFLNVKKISFNRIDKIKEKFKVIIGENGKWTKGVVFLNPLDKELNYLAVYIVGKNEDIVLEQYHSLCHCVGINP
jgi:hypothetical protein